MDKADMSNQNWAEPVLADLAQAFRRDGFIKSAEMLDDVRIVLVQEISALEDARSAQMGARQAGLRLVAT